MPTLKTGKIPYVEVHLSNEQVQIFELTKDSMLLGRASDADVPIGDPQISNRHAEIRRTADGRWMLVDLGSRNFTLLNGHPIISHILNHGDTFFLASTKVAFHDPTELSNKLVDNTIYREPSVVNGTLHSMMPYAGRPASRPTAPTPPPVSWTSLLLYKKTIFVSFALVVIPSLAMLWHSITPQYTARGQIRVRSLAPRLVFQTDDNGTIPNYEYYVNTQAGLLRNPTVLQRVLDQSNVRRTRWYHKHSTNDGQPPVAQLASALNIQYIPKTEIIEVSMTGDDPQDVAVIINTTLEEYAKYARENMDRFHDKILQAIEEEYNALQDEVDYRTQTVAELRDKISAASIEQLVLQKKELLDELAEELKIVNLPSSIDEKLTTKSRSASADRIPARMKTRKRQTRDSYTLAPKAQPINYEAFFGDLHKKIIDVEQIYNSVHVLADERKVLDQKKALLTVVQNRLDQKEIERNAPSSVEVMAKALPPSHPSLDRRKNLSLAIALAGMVAGLGTGYLRARTNKIIYDARELEHILGEPLLGRLSLLPRGRNLTSKEYTIQRECLRIMRTNLLSRLRGRQGVAIGVTSAELGAGKTTMAIILANSLAQYGRKVLLVDADMHRSSFADHFKIDKGPGLLDILANASQTDPLVKTDNPFLYVLPLGTPKKDMNPDLLINGAITTCLSQWRTEYDFIILDTPSLLPTADTRSLSQTVDGVVLIAREGLTRNENVLEALNILDDYGADFLGMVYLGSMKHVPETFYYPPRTPKLQKV